MSVIVQYLSSVQSIDVAFNYGYRTVAALRRSIQLCVVELVVWLLRILLVKLIDVQVYGINIDGGCTDVAIR